MIDSIRSRRSIRKYTDRPVEEEKLVQLLESARLAPSGSNTQPWHFIVVKSDSGRQKLAEAAHKQEWMLTAPVFIVCVADGGYETGDNLNENSSQPVLKKAIRDTSIAIEHIVLAAEELGLGTCWVAWFTQDQIKPVLNIPPNKYVVSIITVGYPDERPEKRPRKKIDEIVHYENW